MSYFKNHYPVFSKIDFEIKKINGDFGHVELKLFLKKKLLCVYSSLLCHRIVLFNSITR